MTWLDPAPLVAVIERDQAANGVALTNDYEAFAERYGITNRTWARIKNTDGRLRLETVESVADALGMHPTEIYGDAYLTACEAHAATQRADRPTPAPKEPKTMTDPYAPVWEEPPANIGARGRQSAWMRPAELLAENPGQWARFGPITAKTSAHMIRKQLLRFAGGDVEAKSGKADDGQRYVWARRVA